MNILQIGCNTCKDDAFDFISKNQDEVKLFIVIDALPACVEKAKNVYSFLGNVFGVSL